MLPGTPVGSLTFVPHRHANNVGIATEREAERVGEDLGAGIQKCSCGWLLRRRVASRFADGNQA